MRFPRDINRKLREYKVVDSTEPFSGTEETVVEYITEKFSVEKEFDTLSEVLEFLGFRKKFTLGKNRKITMYDSDFISTCVIEHEDMFTIVIPVSKTGKKLLTTWLREI